MLWKICGKLGYVPWKFTKGVCIETILKAAKHRTIYDAIDLQCSKSAEPTSMHRKLLNLIMCDALVSWLQHLESRKEIAELDKGGAGQEKSFWEDVALEFNECSEVKNE